MMTAAKDRRRRELIILAAVLLFFVVLAVLTPQRTFTNNWRATSFSAEPPGARAAYELADRLGWRVERHVTDSIVPDERSVAVVLAPSLQFRAREVHVLLEGVRRGGALLYAMSDETLNDSLRIWRGSPGYQLRADSLAAETGACPVPPVFSERMITMFQGPNLYLATLSDSGAARFGIDTLLTVRPTNVERDNLRGMAPATIVGFPLGRGRVVVAGDVDLFRNANVRICAFDAAVQVVRMYEYLRDGPAGARTRLVFDEYHHGYGARPGTARAIARYLRGTSSGRALAHLGIAGIILLLALGPRTLTPRDPERVERRSPLEHVDALARAYWHVHATRTATRRLLRGLRRRTEHRLSGARRDIADEAFLEWASSQIPARRSDISLVHQALTLPMPRKELPRVGAALQRLEQDLLTSRS